MLKARRFQDLALWLGMAISGIVVFEPSPFDYFFPLLVVIFYKSMKWDPLVALFMILLVLWSSSGLFALIPWINEIESVRYVFVTIYIGMISVFFSLIVNKYPHETMKIIRSGYEFATILSCVLGIMGYFDILDTGQYFSLYGRARSTFKDPNVFGPFLIAPIIWNLQDLLLKKKSIFVFCCLFFLFVFNLFISFSRGATIGFILSFFVLITMMSFSVGTSQFRARIVVLSMFIVVLIVLDFFVALTVPQIRDMFLQRASLLQDYDNGQQGRFGNQLRAVPLLLERPWGLGPLRFSHLFFPEDPHEVFVSVFSSFGWYGGIAFSALTIVTIYVGWRLCLRRSPLQMESIGVWASLFPQILQGIQIDTLHWRHMFILCGCLYGLAAAEHRFSLNVMRKLRA